LAAVPAALVVLVNPKAEQKLWLWISVIGAMYLAAVLLVVVGFVKPSHAVNHGREWDHIVRKKPSWTF